MLIHNIRRIRAIMIKKMRVYMISIVILGLFNSSFCSNAMATPFQKTLNSDKSYNLVTINQSGLNSLKYYAKKIKEAETEIIQLERQLKYIKEGTDKYINNLVRQTILRKRLILLNEKISLLIESGKITAKEYYSVFPKQ